MESKKLYNFYHIFADGQWEPSVTAYITALKSSNLYYNLEGFLVGIVGSLENRKAVKIFLESHGILFTVVAESKTGWEQVTQVKLAQFSKSNDGYVLYAHSKGSSDPSLINIAWCRSMICCNVVKWQDMVAKLEVVQVAGSHWLTPEKYKNIITTPFFGGTFWWARLEYIRTLDEPKTDNRWQAEAWIGEKNPSVYDNNPGWPGFSIFKTC